MSKVNFTKVEEALDEASHQFFIDSLTELSTITNMLQNPEKKIGKDEEEIIARFQRDLKRIKTENYPLFEKLGLTEEEEEQILRSFSDYRREDWARLKYLKERIDELRREVKKKFEPSAVNDEIVEKEKKRHINKRHNVREGWLPL